MAQKRDMMPALAVGMGVVAVGAGVYFFARKPKGVDPGDVVLAKFSFNYAGDGGTYILQVSFGKILIGNWFDHIEGLTFDMQVILPAAGATPKHWEFTVQCRLPEATAPKIYDAEALIRTPEMDPYDYIVKMLTQGAINVRKA